MFEEFYSFVRPPFGRDLQVSELFLTESHKEMLARMQYAAERRQFALCTGEVGAGKSTMARLLDSKLSSARYVVLYITDSDLTPRNFYYEVLHQLGHIPRFYRGDAKRQLNRVILDLYENHRKTPVIIIDEGHLLKREMLEEIRFLTNFKMDSFSPMSLILLGQPELRRILSTQIYEAIVQRLNLRFHLPGMSLEETKATSHITCMLPGQPTPCSQMRPSRSFMTTPRVFLARSTMSAWHLCWLGLQRENG